ncbi:MAG TPA: hypothetical protein VFA92_07345 [Candidatus Binatia bacterium]|nr:hypothetical protein [Candidatus Binatia bacterium]
MAIIERADHPCCMQVWRTIAPHVRGYFHRDSRRHDSLHDTAREPTSCARCGPAARRRCWGCSTGHIHTTIELDPAVRGSTRDSTGT